MVVRSRMICYVYYNCISKKKVWVIIIIRESIHFNDSLKNRSIFTLFNITHNIISKTKIDIFHI